MHLIAICSFRHATPNINEFLNEVFFNAMVEIHLRGAKGGGHIHMSSYHHQILQKMKISSLNHVGFYRI